MSDPREEVFRRFDVRQPERPAYVVWELTLRCDQPCTHCGSRAGSARPRELTTEEALRVVRQLAAMGTFEVVLIGGEAYLHEGFLEIIRAMRGAGIRPTMTTGGRGTRWPSSAAAGCAKNSCSLKPVSCTSKPNSAATFAAVATSITWLIETIVPSAMRRRCTSGAFEPSWRASSPTEIEPSMRSRRR